MITFENDIMYYMVKSLVVVVGTLAMMSSCMKIQCTPKKVLISLALYLSWVGVFTFTTMKLFGMVMTLRLCVPMISVPAMFVLYFISNYSPWQAVFNYTMQLSVSVMLAVTQTLTVTLIGGGRIADLIIRISTYILCVFAEYKFLRKRFLLLDYLQDKSWRTLTFVPIGFTALLFLIGTYPVHYTKSPESTIYIYAVTVVMILVYVTVFYSLIGQYNLQLAKYTNTVLAAQSESFQKQLEAINSTEKQIKIMRHDMRYNLIVVSDMIAAGDNEGVLEYIGAVGKKLDETKEAAYCSNPTANAILAYYAERAQSRAIKTEIRFAMPESVNVDIMDFTAVVANALDNAVSACSKVPEKQRRLRVRTAETNQYIIEIANSYSGSVVFDEEGLPVSQKSGHGIGTRSISEFAKKNNAVLDYDVTEDWFKLRIVFPGR